MNTDIIAYHISNILLIIGLMGTLCGCLVAKNVNRSDKKESYSHNETRSKLHLSLDTNYNLTDMTPLLKDFRYGNGTVNNSSETVVTATEQRQTDTSSKDPDEKPLPIPLMVATPAVAVFIFIFICVAYQWHTAQLDAQARKLAEQVASGECPSPCIPCSPCHNTQRLLPPSHSMNSTSSCHSDSDLFGARRKSLRTPSPVLLVPPRLANHRGSSWSALSDQEVISHSPRRHSTFLL